MTATAVAKFDLNFEALESLRVPLCHCILGLFFVNLVQQLFAAIGSVVLSRFTCTICVFDACSWIKISQADKEIARVSVGSIFALLGLGIIMHVIFLLVNFAVAVFFK